MTMVMLLVFAHRPHASKSPSEKALHPHCQPLSLDLPQFSIEVNLNMAVLLLQHLPALALLVLRSKIRELCQATPTSILLETLVVPPELRSWSKSKNGTALADQLHDQERVVGTVEFQVIVVEPVTRQLPPSDALEEQILVMVQLLVQLLVA